MFRTLLKSFLAWDGLAPGEGGFIQAALTAAPFVLNALGGVFGKKNKYVDPEELRSKFGPRAIASDAQAITQYILNSPYGQQLMASAATQGQDIQTEMAAQTAGAGLSPDSGGESGAGTFAAAAGTQAQAGLERATKANIWQQAMPIAAQQNATYAGLHVQNAGAQNGDVTPWQKIAAAAGSMVKKPGEQEE